MPSPLRTEDLQACLTHPRTTIATTAGPVEYADRGHGEPLLAVHGTLGGCDQGLVATEFFRANGFRIIAPSRPGYLGTPLSTGRTPAEQADALAALLNAIGIERISVFAGSGGGPAAYALAARHRDRVTRLVQIDSVCLPIPPLPFARLSARDPATRLQLWLLRHATVPLLKMLFRRDSNYFLSSPVVFLLLAKLAELWPTVACLPTGQGVGNSRRKSATQERRSRFCGPQAPGGTTGARQAGADT